MRERYKLLNNSARSIAVLMVSAVMLLSNTYNKVAGYVGILDGVIALAYYPISTVTGASIFVPEGSGVLLLVWLILVGLRLFQLSQCLTRASKG